MKGVRFRVNPAAWLVVIMKRAFYVIVFVWFDSIMCQNLRYGQSFFDFGDLHLKNILKFLYVYNQTQKYKIIP